MNMFEDFIGRCIFRVPKDIMLPEDACIQEPLKVYNKDEDIQLKQQLEAVYESIAQVTLARIFVSRPFENKGFIMLTFLF